MGVIEIKKNGEYIKRGEYHKNIDKDWSYYPIYVRKIDFLDNFIRNCKNKDIKILDLGCGEGVLVEKYKKEGYDIIGVDINYSSEHVLQKDLFKTGFEDESFDIILFMDVIEHLDYPLQNKALIEIRRLLKKSGNLLISIPNLAHKKSRWNFFFHGELIRTANPNKHIGDRPIKEYINMLNECNFEILKRLPIKLTMPRFQEAFFSMILGKKLFEKLVYSEARNPDDCFLNIFILKKK